MSHGNERHARRGRTRRTPWTVIALPAGIVPLVALLTACPQTPAPGEPGLGAPTPASVEVSAAPNEQVSSSVQFQNTGDAELTFDLQSTKPWLVPTPSSGSVAAGDTQSITVTATCPATAGTDDAVLTVHSNDPKASSAAVSVALTCAVPPPPALVCEELPDPGYGGPTLHCVATEAGVTIDVPYQGEDVRVDSLPLDGFTGLPADGDFTPTDPTPRIRLGVYPVSGSTPLQTFDPPLEITMAYGAAEFSTADPSVGSGELALGVWDPGEPGWIVAGKAVFHDGFWVADPIGSAGLELVGNAFELKPRFALSGDANGGTVTALFGSTPPSLPLGWGAMPPDPGHMLKPFDSCAPITMAGVGSAIECVASMPGVTVRVPYQNGGTVIPKVISLPWNLSTTFMAPGNENQASWSRSLMNFVIVDASDPSKVLTSFDPPIEFVVAYGPEDKDPNVNPFLALTWWDETSESIEILGGGDTTSCDPPSAGCTWGGAFSATATTDPAFNGAFFRADDTYGNGRAKFTFDRWGDRMVMYGN